MNPLELRRFYTGETFYSDWMPREGDNAIFRAEAIDVGGTSPKLKIEFYTKNSNATSSYDGTLIGAANAVKIELTEAGSFDQELIESKSDPNYGLLELVRCKFTVTGTSAWILGRMLPTVFFDTADGTNT